MRWLFLLFIVAFGCTPKQQEITSEQVKLRFGEFETGELIKTKPVDVSATPIHKKIQNHPDQFKYLERVEVNSMIYQSDGLMVTGFLVKPKNLDANTPVILYNRGGNQEYGRLHVGHAVEILAPLADQGFIVAATNYRGNSGGEGKEQFGGDDVNDIFNLIDALGQIQHADTSRVGLFGLSRGGMMTYLALRQDRRHKIDAVANLGAITDMRKTVEYHPEIGAVCQELIPGFVENQEDLLDSRSAVKWAHELPKDVPMLIIHGTEDQSVTYLQIPDFVNRIRTEEIPYRAIIYEGDNHGCRNHQSEVLSHLQTWFSERLIEEQPYQEQVFEMISEGT